MSDEPLNNSLLPEFLCISAYTPTPSSISHRTDAAVLAHDVGGVGRICLHPIPFSHILLAIWMLYPFQHINRLFLPPFIFQFSLLAKAFNMPQSDGFRHSSEGTKVKKYIFSTLLLRTSTCINLSINGVYFFNYRC